MKKIVNDLIKRYEADTITSEEAANVFVHSLRKCAGDDKKLLDLIRSLSKRYNETGAPLLYRMSAACYEAIELGKGIDACGKCLKMCDYEAAPGYSVNESLAMKDEQVTGCKELNVSVEENLHPAKGLGRYFPEDACVVAISEKEKVYCYKEPDGALVLLGVENCNQDILCDEDTFIEGELPFYFTATTHFVSPVFKIGMLSTLLNELLLHIGYPYVRIKKKVLYTAPDVRLINEDDMWDDPWQGLDLENVYGRNVVLKKLEAMNDKALSQPLKEVLAVAALLYDDLFIKKISEPERIKEVMKRFLKDKNI